LAPAGEGEQLALVLFIFPGHMVSFK